MADPTMPEDYKLFRKLVAQQKAHPAPPPSRPLVVQHALSDGTIVQKTWTFYDSGPRESMPLVCVPGVGGRAEVFHRQLACLAPRGVRAIALTPPAYYDVDSWCDGLGAFMQRLGVDRAHFFGVGLGGFLVQSMARRCPARVVSLVLCNSFCSTTHFANTTNLTKLFEWMPEFLLKRQVLQMLPTIELTPAVADSVDFYVPMIESLSQGELGSQLTLMHTPATIAPPPLPESRVLVMQTVDGCTLMPSEQCEEEILKCYAAAKQALLKTGGPFPFLANADEVNMFLQVHVRAQNAALAERESAEAPNPTSI
eukprot:m51a1_g6699 hypothetical protein (311) ;mRNA; f:90778-91990